jgi:hypothetical protein
MKPIIFLDIEGVISTQYGLDNALKTKGETHDNTGKPLFCTASCEHISRLIEHYDAEIVLISSWRKSFKKLENGIKFFKERGLRWPIIDFTPITPGALHAEEIHQWMENNYVPKRYVIIDADNDILDYFPAQVVNTEGLSGFADRKLYRKAMNILKKDASPIIEKAKEPEQKLF